MKANKRILFFDLVIIFFIFSFIGWAYEVILSIVNQSFCDPGFLVGPYLVVYGSTVILVFLILGSRKEKRGIIKIMTKNEVTNIILMAIIYMVICGICVTAVEYFSAKALYNNFRVRLWDYSVLPYHYNGFISLPTTLLWIVLIPIIMLVVFDPIYKLVKKIPIKITKILSIILILILVCDVIFNVYYILVNGCSYRLYMAII